MSAPFPILLYHRVDQAGLSTSTPPAVFRAHLELLKRNGWRTLPSDEFSYYLDSGAAPPRRSFLITFDDGYASVHDSALPILRELGFHAIAFLSTQYMREPRTGVATSDPDGEAGKFLSWDQARALQASGVVDCQSHSHAHTNFSSFEVQAIRADLQSSIDMLTGELRLPYRHFRHLAWPWGLSLPAWREAAAAIGLRYQHGVSRQSFRPGMDLHDIPRTCFDATPLASFQRQFWLQTGSCAPLWDIAYPVGRKLRGFSRLLKAA